MVEPYKKLFLRTDFKINTSELTISQAKSLISEKIDKKILVFEKKNVFDPLIYSPIANNINQIANREMNSALIIIDGQISNRQNLQILKKENIRLVTLYNGIKAIKSYGEKGKNGVIEVFTKL